MFVRGGFVRPGDILDFAGHSGVYWFSVGRSSSDAYYLDFNSGAVYPSVNLDRYYGLSLRCVALGD